ncbi:hypothetical protein [Arthrobacter sp. LAPM80]|uniref:hypothetical protein n=1 Tax=Arthrobacter sp. LAPM80 TaxID=3141788 RepID=UPI00398AD6B1
MDCALWDLKARLLDLPLYPLLGAVRDEADIWKHGSGRSTAYSHRQLEDQLAGWIHCQYIPRVKMKIGQDRGANVRIEQTFFDGSLEPTGGAIAPDARSPATDSRSAKPTSKSTGWVRPAAAMGCTKSLS